MIRPYLPNDDLFVVIEGNRRLAALRWIAEDYEAGVSVPDQVRTSLENVPVIVVEDADADPIFQAALMGVRHVSGIKDWGGLPKSEGGRATSGRARARKFGYSRQAGHDYQRSEPQVSCFEDTSTDATGRKLW